MPSDLDLKADLELKDVFYECALLSYTCPQTPSPRGGTWPLMCPQLCKLVLIERTIIKKVGSFNEFARLLKIYYKEWGFGDVTAVRY